jgi:hypothetical protein
MRMGEQYAFFLVAIQARAAAFSSPQQNMGQRELAIDAE